MQHAVLTRSDGSDPPPILQLVAHPVRWRLLQELVHSDRAVAELTDLLEAPQSLVSYHLGSCERASSCRCVAVRRIGATATTASISLVAGSCSKPPAAPSTRAYGSCRRRRHPMAPTVAAHVVDNGCCSCAPGTAPVHRWPRRSCNGSPTGRVEAASAGSNPKPLHPNAVRVMKQRGIDISANRTKHLDEFASQRFDVVITLCDRVREVCPEFPSHPELVHWSMPDPALEGPTDRDSYPAFERTASELETRIRFLLAALNEPSTRRLVMADDEMVNVRYMVDDVDESIAFYTKHLGFELLTIARPPSPT